MDPDILEFLELRKYCDGAYVPPPPSGPQKECFLCGEKRTTHRTLIMKETADFEYEPDEVLPCCLECESTMMEV